MKDDLYNQLYKSVTKLKAVIRSNEISLPKDIKYLEDGGIIVTIYKGRRTITRALFADGMTAEGHAKCNAGDKYSRKIGMEISKARCYREWSDKGEALWIDRVKSLSPIEEPKKVVDNVKYSFAFGKTYPYTVKYVPTKTHATSR